MVKGIEKSNNWAHANISILLANLLISDINEFAISVVNIFTDLIIGTPLSDSYMHNYTVISYHRDR